MKPKYPKKNPTIERGTRKNNRKGNPTSGPGIFGNKMRKKSPIRKIKTS